MVIFGVILLFWQYLQAPLLIFRERDFKLTSVAPVPVLDEQCTINNAQCSADQLLSQLTAQSVYAIDIPSAATLLSKNEDEPLYPASTVKMMTALTAMKLYGDRDTFIIEQADFEDTNKNEFAIGEEFSRDDLLKALLITSDNDIALTLAKHHSAGENGFVREMNALAQSYHLNKTFFRNPTGFDHLDQLATARDLSFLARELMKNEFLKGVVGIKEATITNTSGHLEHHLKTTNEFLAKEFGIVGIKTGTTELAGEVLVTQVEKGGQQIMIVVMNSQDRFTDTKKIIDWIFNNYDWHVIPGLTRNLENN